jgi:uncharacterized RDD family membrane protein YckC
MENQNTSNIIEIQPLEIPTHSVTNLAPFWRRAIALIIDDTIVIAFSFIITIILTIIGGGPKSVYLVIGVLLFFIFGILYNAVMISIGYDGTFGKQLLNIQVTDLDGNRISQKQAFRREGGKIITRVIPFYIGWLIYFFTKNKQTLHDLIGNTKVIKN